MVSVIKDTAGNRPTACGLADFFVVVLMVVLGVGDTVLIAVLMWTFNRSNPPGCSPTQNSSNPCSYDGSTNEDYAIYINQATGTFYGLITFPLLALWSWCGWNRSQTSAEKSKPKPPYRTLIAIGCMNGLGNFCAAVGGVHTGGTSQALLQLVGIPFVLGLAWIFLGQKPSFTATMASLAIVGGTALSAVPHSENDTDSLWYSNILFFSAQIFFSGEKVYEEATFGIYNVDVLWMFLWTLWTQVLLGWVTWPVQAVPAFGGIDTSQIPSIVWDGLKCNAGISTHGRPYCDWQNPVLFFAYCAVDYSYYAIGLYIIQTRGANLMILATAISLPLSQLAFCIREVAGPNTSKFLWTDAVALVIVLGGFILFYLVSPEGQKQRHGTSRHDNVDNEEQPLLINTDP